MSVSNRKWYNFLVIRVRSALSGGAYRIRMQREDDIMLQLAVCDDEKVLRSDLRKILSTELELCGIDHHIEEFASGEELPSVMATTVAPASAANRQARTVRVEYRGKLMPMRTSSGPTRTICSYSSLVEEV